MFLYKRVKEFQSHHDGNACSGDTRRQTTLLTCCLSEGELMNVCGCDCMYACAIMSVWRNLFVVCLGVLALHHSQSMTFERRSS